MEHLHDLIELGKELNVLYVEDDENLRLETTKIIERIFKSVDVASDGVEGFDAFSKARYDLIITDIEMPEVDGIELSRKIRAMDKEMPIVVVSAYSNTDYFMDAIALGIDYYILKPIKMPRLIDTLFAAVKRVVDKRIADQYRQKEISQKIQEASQNMLAEITNVSPNPTVVYSNGSITFMNGAFQDLFDEDDLKELVENEQYLWTFLNKKISIDSVIHTKSDFIEQLDSSELQGNKHKISLRTKKGRKIFFVFRNSLNLDVSDENAVYTFNDITVLEYQKVQIDQYHEYMNELTYTKYKSTESEGQPDIIDKIKF